MEPKTSMRNARVVRAFYLPATAAVRRFERAVSSMVRDRSQLVRGRVAVEPIREFYLPATAVVSSMPGRIGRVDRDRLVNRGVERLVNRGVVSRDTVERVREFYLPATFRR